jgi:hypothetical protein
VKSNSLDAFHCLLPQVIRQSYIIYFENLFSSLTNNINKPAIMSTPNKPAGYVRRKEEITALYRERRLPRLPYQWTPVTVTTKLSVLPQKQKPICDHRHRQEQRGRILDAESANLNHGRAAKVPLQRRMTLRRTFSPGIR